MSYTWSSWKFWKMYYTSSESQKNKQIFNCVNGFHTHNSTSHFLSHFLYYLNKWHFVFLWLRVRNLDEMTLSLSSNICKATRELKSQRRWSNSFKHFRWTTVHLVTLQVFDTKCRRYSRTNKLYLQYAWKDRFVVTYGETQSRLSYMFAEHHNSVMIYFWTLMYLQHC